MPNEFKNLSDEVSKGTEQITDALDKNIEKAKETDKVHQALTKTYAKSVEMGKKLSDSVKNTKDEWVHYVKTAASVKKHTETIGKTTAKTRKSLEDYSGSASKAADANKEIAGYASTLNDEMEKTSSVQSPRFRTIIQLA